METLLVLTGDHLDEVRAEIGQRHARITQEASPRVVVVSGEAQDIELLLQRSDVVSGQGLESAASGATIALTAAEDLFVKAWLQRRRIDESVKKRPGDGLSWGTKGYDPP